MENYTAAISWKEGMLRMQNDTIEVLERKYAFY
jgi:hypothetical protein